MSDEILSLPPPACDVRLSYGPQPSQFGELFLPEDEGSRAVVVALHGGFWRARYGLDYLGHACRALTKLGVAVWSLEYRRLGEEGGGWPGTRDDVIAGTRYLRQIAQRYALDLDRTVVLGHSAGGHLAWCVAREVPVRGVVALAGVSDLVEASRLRLSRGGVDEFLGGSPEQLPERYAEASPMAWNDLKARQILIHGTEDEDVPYAMSRAYAGRHDAQVVTLRGMGHYEAVDPGSAAWPRVVEAVRALL